MDKISLFHGQKFAISEFSQYIKYAFFKENYKNNFHTNKYAKLWFPAFIIRYIKKFTRVGGKYGILFTISGFVYIRFSHFDHFGIVKIAQLNSQY